MNLKEKIQVGVITAATTLSGVLLMYSFHVWQPTNLEPRSAKKPLLQQRFNILNWQRYDIGFLEKMLDEKYAEQEKPLAISFFPRYDRTNAFKWHNQDRETFLLLSQKYKLFICETETNYQVLELSKRLTKKHGKAELIIIGGHGTEYDLRLGQQYGGLTFIAENAHCELLLQNLSDLLTANARIVLNSCSTGASVNNSQNIARFISQATNRTVYAPVHVTKEFYYYPNADSFAFDAPSVKCTPDGTATEVMQ